MLRNATTGTFFAYKPINTAEVWWESWNLQGNLKFSFESTSTCPSQTAESPLSANCNSTTARPHVISRLKYPACEFSCVRLYGHLILSLWFLSCWTLKRNLNIELVVKVILYLLCTCLLFCCSPSGNNNCLCVKEQYFSNSQASSNGRWCEKVQTGLYVTIFLVAKL